MTDPEADRSKTPPDRAAEHLAARLLRAVDDVATALQHLPAGRVVRVAQGGSTREVTLREDIRIGHKFAVRELARGLRIRKYGEFIGRTTCDIAAGAWVHEHNLETAARRDGVQALAWYRDAETPAALQALGDARCHVGENPLYDAAHDRLYWIDVRETPAIHMLALAGGAARSWPLAEDIGSIALAGGGRLLAALRSGFAFFDTATGRLEPITDPEPQLPHNRMNDGRCDPAGRYWCGSMNPESGSADGSLYVLDRRLGCRRVEGDFLTPNGIAWSPDGSVMYLADTRRGAIYVYPFDSAQGRLGPRRVFADLGAMPGGPDGATVDAEGYLWSAQFDGGCIVRYAPDGRTDRVIRLPVTKPTACGFGGAGWRQLFVTTATRGLGAQELRAEPLAGRVLVLDVGVAGLPPVPFMANARAKESVS